jgi:hypothetical protein
MESLHAADFVTGCADAINGWHGRIVDRRLRRVADIRGRPADPTPAIAAGKVDVLAGLRRHAGTGAPPSGTTDIAVHQQFVRLDA